MNVFCPCALAGQKCRKRVTGGNRQSLVACDRFTFLSFYVNCQFVAGLVKSPAMCDDGTTGQMYERVLVTLHCNNCSGNLDLPNLKPINNII